MKKFTTIAFFFLIVFTPFFMHAQAPAIQWNKLLGGNEMELPGNQCIKQTSDGGYIMTTSSRSSQSGDVSGVKHGDLGNFDFWVVKLDAAGNKVWDKLLGGDGWDQSYSIQQTTDGGYILAGSSGSSQSGDVSGVNHTSDGNADLWIVKLDADGNKQWDKLYGGSGADGFNTSIQQTNDGYIVGCISSGSSDGDVTGTNHGIIDSWILKLDVSGNKVWDKLLGGAGIDELSVLQQTTDGGYIAAGYSTSSQSGDVSGINHGTYADAWVVKLDASGNKQWDKLLGGTGDEFGYGIVQDTSGGYVLAVTSNMGSSQSGDISGVNHGINDIWIVNLNAAGTIVWEKLYGGNFGEGAASIQQTADGGYVVAGSTLSSQNGDVTGIHHGSPQNDDAWILKIDGSGSKLWDKVLGGDQSDDAVTILQTTDGGFIVAAQSGSSQTGDVTDINRGVTDVWLIKLAPDPAAGSLPVTMLSFTAKAQDAKVLLNWSTATEQNTKDFIVQRSSDGFAWTNIGSVAAAGNSSSVKQYSFNDAQPGYGVNMYRLLQRDLDGKSTFSDVRTVNLAGAVTGFRLLGNPVTNGNLLVELQMSSAVSIVNMQGVQVFKKQFAAGRQSILMDKYPKGTYTIKVGSEAKLFVVQ